MEVYLVYNDGWITEKLREELLGTCSLNIANFISNISSKEKQVFFYLIKAFLFYVNVEFQSV
jgi:hypothetical protein